MRQYIDTLQDVNGNALVGASVLVQNFIGGANASIFSDNGLTPIVTATVAAGADGQFSFYAADGDYNLVMSKNATIFKTQSPVTLFDGTPQLTYTDTGAVNAYATANSALEKALRPGLRTSFKAVNTNTGASTYQYNGLAVKPLIQRGNIPLSNAAVVVGGIYAIEYDGTSWQLLGDPAAAPFYPRSALEIAAGAVPTSFNYPYGCPRRFGAVGDGVTNDTAAVQTAINSNTMYWGWQGDNYLVTTVIWPAAGLSVAHFNGSQLIGGATVATTCISQVKSNFTTFYDYAVNGGSFGGITPNSNYTCATWWFNGVASGSPVGASQFNTFYGMQHISCVRGLVYGGLPTLSNSTIVHSENKIYGFQSTGVSNPCYINSSTGFVHFYGAVFFRDASTWTVPNLPASARAYEQVVGNLYINGGEIIASNSTLGNATDGSAIVTNAYIELACPININSDNARYTGCRINLPNQGINMVTIAAATTGVLAFNACTFLRTAGNGATDRTPMITSASAAFEVDLNMCTSFEWGWLMAGANCKLVAGCVARYTNHRLSITAADANVYLINNPKVSLYPEATLDHLGYTTTGWVLETISGGGTTLLNTTNAGPTGYLASQLTLHATGQARAWSGDPTSLATLKTTAIRVRPGDAFWLSGQVQSNGGTVQLAASFYTLAGAAISVVPVADATSIGSGAWVSAEGPLVAPATAAYMIVGLQGIVSDVQFTDVRLQRAA